MHTMMQVAFFALFTVLAVNGSVMHHENEMDVTIPLGKLSRMRRSTNCAPKFSVFTSTHTACLAGSNASVVSAADQTLIVTRHNTHRAAASPTASNMLKMKWDDELAMIAQKWAENCNFGHDANVDRNIPARFSVGQNIAQNVASGWTAVVDLWHSEVSQFTYGDTNFTFSKIGHYTQVMWAKTTLVGCGVKLCNGQNLHVCNYGPAGNLGSSIHTPYASGTSCSGCATCVDSTLCDCNYLACRNGGTLTISTCSCACAVAAPLYKTPDCGLNCTGTTDSYVCAGYTVANCPGYASWCPHMCGVCPYGEDGYTAPVAPTTTTTTTSTTTTTTQPGNLQTTTQGTGPNPPGGKGTREATSCAVVVLALALARWLW